MRQVIILITGLLFVFACTSDADPASTTSAVQTAASVTTPSEPVASRLGTENAESPDIKVQVNNAPAGMSYLIGTYVGNNYRVDSSRVDNKGSLRFKRDEPYIPGMYFVVFQDNSNFQVLVSEDQTMTITADAADIIGTLQVQGNIDTKLLADNGRYERAYATKLDPVNAQIKQFQQGTPEYQQLKQQQDAIIAERAADLEKIFQQHPTSLFTSFKQAGQNPAVKDIRNPDGSLDQQAQVFAFRSEFWDNVDFSDDRLLYTPVISNKLNRYISQLTPQNPDSIIAAASLLVNKSLPYPEFFKYFANQITMMYTPTESTLMDAEKVYVFMIQNYFTTDRAFWSDAANIQGLQQRAYEMAASVTGVKAPDVTAPGINGKERSIYDLKADYIIVYLYNPTCEHCMEQTPKLVNLYNQYKAQGKSLDVYAIAIDTNDAEWRDYVAKNGLSQWSNVHDPTNKSIYAKYYVNITPEVYVLNPDRMIIGKNLKVNQIDDVIDRDRNN
jgi:peroxiredoxin